MRDAGVLLSQPGKWHRNPTCELVILGDEDMNVPPQVTQKLSEWASQTITVKGYGTFILAVCLSSACHAHTTPLVLRLDLFT